VSLDFVEVDQEVLALVAVHLISSFVEPLEHLFDRGQQAGQVGVEAHADRSSPLVCAALPDRCARRRCRGCRSPPSDGGGYRDLVLQRLDLRGLDGFAEHLPRPAVDQDEPVAAVRAIIEEVRAGGDEALRELTERFDGVRPGALSVDEDDLADALAAIDPQVRRALEVAAARIADHHREQLLGEVAHEGDGVRIRSYRRPVRRAGCYVPGGRAAYPSTLLMTAVPALVAGVEDVAVCVPLDRGTGRIAPVTLAAAAVAGVHEVHPVGGAQAIAALAYGTESIAAVDVICGPGNRYVALAKQQVAGQVGIAAAFAGPSEVVVVADHSVPAELAAIDIILQAEHGPDGLAWLITWDPAVADAVTREVTRLTEASPRRDEITATLSSSGYAVVVEDPSAALEVADLVAPEHLELLCEDAAALAERVQNAGAIFLGPWSPASIGDYAAGPSHVLPTHGSARFSSALTVDDFLKHHHVIEVDRSVYDDGGLGDVVEVLADAEGLTAHADSVRLRRGRTDTGGRA